MHHGPDIYRRKRIRIARTVSHHVVAVLCVKWYLTALRQILKPLLLRRRSQVLDGNYLRFSTYRRTAAIEPLLHIYQLHESFITVYNL